MTMIRITSVFTVLTVVLVFVAFTPANATHPGINGRIAFTGLEEDETTNIYTINPDGTDLQQLTNFDNEDGAGYLPIWSPDGNYIAYTSVEYPTLDSLIRRMRADGSAQTTLLVTSINSPAYLHSGQAFSWSSDRHSIALTAGVQGPGEGGYEVFTIDYDGTNLTRITDGQLTSTAPSWSPDGTKFAIQRNLDEVDSPNIFIIDSDGSNPQQLTNDPLPDEYPDWSPDGSRILYTHGDNSHGGSEVWVMNPDGSYKTKLADGGQGRWSPDGQQIVFARSGGIWIMNADGSNQHSVPGTTGASSPNWSPVSAGLPVGGTVDITVAPISTSVSLDYLRFALAIAAIALIGVVLCRRLF